MTKTLPYWITPALSFGPFLSPARVSTLQAAGITDILNVSDARSYPQTLIAGFRAVVFIPIADCVPIEVETAMEFLAALDEMFHRPGARVYVHCLAGQNRSPTVVWLYLKSLGVDAEVAKQMIEAASPTAIGGHPLLVSQATIRTVSEYRLARSDEDTLDLRRVVLS